MSRALDQLDVRRRGYQVKRLIVDREDADVEREGSWKFVEVRLGGGGGEVE